MNEKLLKIQTALHAGKDQKNDFGGFNYRSAEGIYEKVKPLLKEEGCQLTVSDEVENVGAYNYVKATAVFTDLETGEQVTATAYAREAENKKGMDASQMTGSCSSYARKYALGGLFLIDDAKQDPDSNEATEKRTAMIATITKQEKAVIETLIEETETDAKKLMGYYKVDDLSQLTKAEYAEIVMRLKKRADK